MHLSELSSLTEQVATEKLVWGWKDMNSAKKKKTISQKALTIHASRVKNTLTCRKQAGYQFCHHNEYHLTRFVLVKLRSICHILIVIPSSCFIYILYDHIKGFIAKQNKNVYTRVSRNTYSFQVQIISPKRHGLQII